MIKYFTLRLPGAKPYAVAKLEDGIAYQHVPGRGWVDMPELMSYLAGGEPGAEEVAKQEADRLISAGVGVEVSPAALEALREDRAPRDDR